MSVKLERTQSDMQKTIASIIRNDVKNKDLMLVSITGVELTKDLNQAKVYYTSLGGPAKQQSDLKALNESKSFIKKMLSQKMKLRNTPNLTFIYDNRNDLRNDMEKLLSSINVKKTDN